MVVSPGCFADLNSFSIIIQELSDRDTLVCFVMTNMYAGSKEQRDGMHQHLLLLASKICKGNMLIWDNCLLTSVNSCSYEHESPFGREIYPPRGIDQMIMTAFSLLHPDKMEGLAIAISSNRTLSETIIQNIQEFFIQPISSVLTNTMITLSRMID